MRWLNLVGKQRIAPAQGTWQEWKQVIADHCGAQCVYCAISEARFGGIRNFHIEHFRPKVRFPKLENDIRNLYLACSVCNVLKCDDWPAEPKANHTVPAYPDPSLVDYNTIFLVSGTTHEIESSTVAGQYVIERILLNRPQLIVERWLASVFQLLTQYEVWIKRFVDHMTHSELKATTKILLEISRTRGKLLQARPYRDADTKRPAKPKAAKKRSWS